MPLKVLSALDTARTQYYHFKAIVIAGMGLFTDAYDLFCITPIFTLLGGLYYDNKEIPTEVASALVAIALVGTVIGQLVFGFLGDCKGRRRVYGLSLMIMILSSLACGFSICTTKLCVLLSLGFFRFLLGLGIGGDYPLSATIMSEFANKRTRGAFIAAVFSMQGFGILVSSAVTMVICTIFQNGSHVTSKDKTPKAADIAWRLILMMGGVPAALTYYWRMLMPETARFTALVERDPVQAAVDIGKVLDVPLSQISEDAPIPSYPSTYSLFSKQFLRCHGRDLFSCAASWFLVDIAFYSNNLLQYRVYHNFITKDHSAYEFAIQVAKLQAIVAVCSTIPGYWVTVYFIERIGRVKIQLWGFFMMALVYFAIGIPYKLYWQYDKDSVNIGFGILYGLTFFFANFGPNTTTFIVPAELFPARFRSTCHGISGAMGKVGAIIGTIGFLWASKKCDSDLPDGCLNSHDGPYPIKMTWALVSLGVVCLLGAAVTYFFGRETRGRSLEDNETDNEMESEMDN